MSIEVGDTSDEGHVCKESIDPVKWKEGFGVKKDAYEGKNAGHSVGWDWREFSLFTIEVRECSVSCAERSGVFDCMFHVAWVFVRKQVFEERVQAISGFRDLFSSCYDLFLVETYWKSVYARGRESVLGEWFRGGNREFKGFAFKVVGFFKSIASVSVMLLVLGGELSFKVTLSVGFV